MRRFRSKWIAILATLALLATLLVPMVGPAAAGTTYSALFVPTVVPPKSSVALGTILIDIDTLSSGTHQAVFSLPTDFEFNTAPSVAVATYNGGPVTASIVTNGYQKNEFRLDVTATNVATDVKITVNLTDVKVPSYASGEIKCSITSVGGTQLSSGSVVVAKASSGLVSISAIDVPSITSAGTSGGKIQIQITENAKGAIKKTTNSIVFTLPSGFEWSTSVTVYDLSTGGLATISAQRDQSDKRKLIVDASNENENLRNVYRINADILVDEATAKFGDVSVTISGDTSSNISELVIAKYVDFGVQVSEKTVESVLAGRTDQEIGDFYIEEAAPGSLIGGRTITLKLPANAKWVTNPTIEVEKGNIELGSWSSVDSRTIKVTVYKASTSASKILLKDAKVKLAVDTEGDLAIEVGGSAGASGTVVVAKVQAPIVAKATSVPDVKIGEQAQIAGDIIITETKKEAIDKVQDKVDLMITAPSGITFATVPNVTVTDGDLQIDKVTKDGGVVNIEIKGTSSKPSTIKVSGLKLTVDRTVPVGPVELKISGEGVNKTSDDFANATVAAKVIVANVVTPAPGEQKATATFKVGDTKFTVNGVEQTMDVAPYVKNGRTYLPVRYVAQALGVAPENIFYADGVVTLLKGGIAVQLTIGSNVLKVNGAEIKMDVPAELSNGRTMLPFRWVAQALGATVSWDEATQTVSMTL